MIYQIDSANQLLTMQIKEKDFPLDKFSDRLYETIKKFELATFFAPDGREYKAVIKKRVDLEKSMKAIIYDNESISAYGYQNRRKTILQYKFEPKV
jgi:hypothetical protein